MALFGNTPLSAFSGYPRTTMRTDRHGNKRYTVNDTYLSPYGAKLADRLGAMFATGLFITAIMKLSEQNETRAWVWIAGLVLPFALVSLWRHIFRKMLRSRLHVRLDLDTVKIGRKEFPRHLVTGFIEWEHPDGFKEATRAMHKQQKAQRQKAVKKPPQIYLGKETRVIQCRIGTSRVFDVCEVFGLREIRDILIRLNGINDALNGDLGVGIGTPIDPGADSPDGRNGIPR